MSQLPRRQRNRSPRHHSDPFPPTLQPRTRTTRARTDLSNAWSDEREIDVLRDTHSSNHSLSPNPGHFTFKPKIQVPRNQSSQNTVQFVHKPAYTTHRSRQRLQAPYRFVSYPSVTIATIGDDGHRFCEATNQVSEASGTQSSSLYKVHHSNSKSGSYADKTVPPDNNINHLNKSNEISSLREHSHGNQSYSNSQTTPRDKISFKGVVNRMIDLKRTKNKKGRAQNTINVPIFNNYDNDNKHNKTKDKSKLDSNRRVAKQPLDNKMDINGNNDKEAEERVHVTCYRQLTPIEMNRALSHDKQSRQSECATPPLAVFSSDEDISSRPDTPRVAQARHPACSYSMASSLSSDTMASTCSQLSTSTSSHSADRAPSRSLTEAHKYARHKAHAINRNGCSSGMTSSAQSPVVPNHHPGFKDSLINKEPTIYDTYAFRRNHCNHASSQSSLNSLDEEVYSQFPPDPTLLYTRQHSLPLVLEAENALPISEVMLISTPPVSGKRYPHKGLRRQYSDASVLSNALRKQYVNGAYNGWERDKAQYEQKDTPDRTLSEVKQSSSIACHKASLDHSDNCSIKTITPGNWSQNSAVTLLRTPELLSKLNHVATMQKQTSTQAGSNSMQSDTNMDSYLLKPINRGYTSDKNGYQKSSRTKTGDMKQKDRSKPCSRNRSPSYLPVHCSKSRPQPHEKSPKMDTSLNKTIAVTRQSKTHGGSSNGGISRRHEHTEGKQHKPSVDIKHKAHVTSTNRQRGIQMNKTKCSHNIKPMPSRTAVADRPKSQPKYSAAVRKQDRIQGTNNDTPLGKSKSNKNESPISPQIPIIKRSLSRGGDSTRAKVQLVESSLSLSQNDDCEKYASSNANNPRKTTSLIVQHTNTHNGSNTSKSTNASKSKIPRSPASNRDKAAIQETHDDKQDLICADQNQDRKKIPTSQSSPQLNSMRAHTIPVQHYHSTPTRGPIMEAEGSNPERRSQSYSPARRTMSRTISLELEQQLHKALSGPSRVTRKGNKCKRSSTAIPLTSYSDPSYTRGSVHRPPTDTQTERRCTAPASWQAAGTAMAQLSTERRSLIDQSDSALSGRGAHSADHPRGVMKKVELEMPGSDPVAACQHLCKPKTIKAPRDKSDVAVVGAADSRVRCGAQQGQEGREASGVRGQVKQEAEGGEPQEAGNHTACAADRRPCSAPEQHFIHPFGSSTAHLNGKGSTSIPIQIEHCSEQRNISVGVKSRSGKQYEENGQKLNSERKINQNLRPAFQSFQNDQKCKSNTEERATSAIRKPTLASTLAHSNGAQTHADHSNSNLPKNSNTRYSSSLFVNINRPSKSDGGERTSSKQGSDGSDYSAVNTGAGSSRLPRLSPRHRQRPKSEVLTVHWAEAFLASLDGPVSAPTAAPDHQSESGVNRRRPRRGRRERPKSHLGIPLSMSAGLNREVLMQSGDTAVTKRFERGGFGQFLDVLSLHHCEHRRRMSTPQPIKTRPVNRSPVPAKKQAPRSRWLLLSRMKRCKSEPNLPTCPHKKNLAFLNATSAHAGDIALQSLSAHDDDDTTSEDTTSLRSSSETSSRTSIKPRYLDCIFDEDTPTFAEALWDHVTLDPEELAFHAGDLIQVTDAGDRDWWHGVVREQAQREGWFPAAFVRLHVNQADTEEDLAWRCQHSHMDDAALRRRSTTLLSRDQARVNVVTEIITAERHYVKHLSDVVEGYIEKARKRPEMFPKARMKVIFSNIEEIYEFSATLLADLETQVQRHEPHLSQIGGCFLKHLARFGIYSRYCNKHPAAVEELRGLQRNKQYQHFFEACRLLQQMIEIPLQGFLLTPVQKICKYPLQLKELLKYTYPEHPDYRPLEQALEGMKRIALLINERKRKLESIDKIAQWQSRVEDWEGPDLIALSSELLHSGELHKVNSAGWQQERLFFLFDHQLVYCKKDLLWRDVLIFRGRVNLDQCEIHGAQDGKDSASHVKHGIRIHDKSRDRWLLLHCRTAEVKDAWLEAFRRERSQVQQDRAHGLDLAEYRHSIKQAYRRPHAKKEKKKRLSNKDLCYDMEPTPAQVSAVRSPQRKLSTKEALQYAQSHNKRSGFVPFLKRKIKR